ncbi:MAG: Fic family protein [Candidatus Thermoplasmatota archaeon]|nr:Fic family protein [Candidatus Thermoplasmatota archaeon]
MKINYKIHSPDTPLEEREFGYPVRHKQKMPFAPKIEATPEVGQWNIDIFRLDSELGQFILTAGDYFDLIIEAISSNIHLSTQMEGNPLTLNEVRRLTKRTFKEGIPEEKYEFSMQEIQNHIGIYVMGIDKGPWDISFIKKVHEFLLFGDKSSKPGVFRNNFRSVYSSEGEELFITCPPGHIENEMKGLMYWLRTTGPGYYPVISGALLLHEFESIHPFGDGNGLTGRTLFHLYLHAHGLPNSKLCFIEQEIVSDAERYYDILARADFYQNYEELIIHFTRSVKESYQKAVKKYKEKDLLSKNLDEISKHLLVKAKTLGNEFTLKDTRKWFDNISDFQIRKRLNELVEIDAIWDNGETKGKTYQFADPMRHLMGSTDRLKKVFNEENQSRDKE